MPIIQPDTSQQIDMGPIEPGTYNAKIVACSFERSKEKGTPMIVPELEVNVDGKLRKRKTWVVTEGAGSFNFDQLLRACNFDALADTYKDPNVANPDFDTDSLIGQELQVVVDTQLDKQGNPRDNIKTFLKA